MLACTHLDGVPVAVAGGEDATLRVWDLTGHREPTSIRIPGAKACALAVGPANEVVLGVRGDLVVLDRRP
jgi:hypothetical protein